MGLKTKNNSYRKIIEETLEKGEELGAVYESFGPSEFLEFGNVETKNVWGLLGYQIALRENSNFFVNDLLTVGNVEENDLEKIINLNEKIAKNLGCTSISVEWSDENVAEFYKNKNYIFNDGEYIGVKKL